MKIDPNELDLEYMEQDAEEHLTQHEATLLGLKLDAGSIDPGTDAPGWILA